MDEKRKISGAASNMADGATCIPENVLETMGSRKIDDNEIKSVVKRRRFSSEFKLEVVRCALERTNRKAAKHYDISEKQVRYWIKDMDGLKELSEQGVVSYRKKRGKEFYPSEIDRKVYDWYCCFVNQGKSVSKEAIQSFANEQYINHGYSSLKADDVWYCDWFAQYVLKTNERESNEVNDLARNISMLENDLPSVSKVENSSLSNHSTDQTLNCGLNNPSEAISMNSSTNSDINMIMKSSPVEKCNNNSKSNLEDYLDATIRISDLYYIMEEAQNTPVNICKENVSFTKGERYSQAFKQQVVEYAKNHTYKDTAKNYNIHHSTVSEWTKSLSNYSKPRSEQNKCDAEKILDEWLSKNYEVNRNVVDYDVKGKVKDIIDHYGLERLKKSCFWMVLWSGRFVSGINDKAKRSKVQRVSYPLKFKLHLLKLIARFSVAKVSKTFLIHRRMLEKWVKLEGSFLTAINKGRLFKDGADKRVDCAKSDRVLFDWYSKEIKLGKIVSQRLIQEKAVDLLRQNGFADFQCTDSWLYKWCSKYNVDLRYSYDSLILEWVLSQYDQNRSIMHSDIQKVAHNLISKNKPNFKCSIGWALRFCKRNMRLLHTSPQINVPLPVTLLPKVVEFRNEVRKLQSEYGISLANFGNVDQIPLNFTRRLVQPNKRTLLLRRSGFENHQAVLIFCCLADGGILPPFTVLKGKKPPFLNFTCNQLVDYDENGRVDGHKMLHWFHKVWQKNVTSGNLLVLDSYDVNATLSFASKTSDSRCFVKVIPPGCSSKLQPIEVGLKKVLLDELDKILESSEFTINSNFDGKEMSDDKMMECIAKVWHMLSTKSELVRRSFAASGLIEECESDNVIDNINYISSMQ